MKHLLLLLVLMATTRLCSGQIATWNSTNGVGSTGVTAGTAVKGAGITNGAGTCTNNVLTNTAFFDAGDAGGEAEAIAQNEYVEFPVTAQAGYKVTATSVTFTSRHSPTGVKDFAIYDGNSVNLGSGTQPTQDACESFTIDITDVVINPGTTVNFRFYGWSATNAGGNWRIAQVSIDGTAALPIELMSFQAQVSDFGALLSFSTATEINNDYFSIERSTNGRDFVEIGQLQGSGTSYSPQSYRFSDERPEKGRNYYRLKQVDFDGKFTYSNIIQVTFGRASQMTLAPMPATETLVLQLEKALREDGFYQIFDLNGRLLISGQMPAETKEQSIQINDLAEGAYLLRLAVGQEVLTEQFWKHQ